MEKRTSRGVLQYCLTDFLEVHGFEQRGEMVALVQRLLSAARGGTELSHLTCAALGESLIVIQDGHANKIKRLCLVNSRQGSLRTFGMHDE